MPPGPPDEYAESLIEGIIQRTDSGATASGDDSELLTFLFADIRGYTTFTQQRGDEAGAKLAAKFAGIVHGLVPDFGGTVVELRGDEALCVFRSPRQCLRFAIALQQRFVEETVADPELPLPVGIGIDAGEAVRVGAGYRGGALNLAARLCGQAKAGQVLASPELAHLARAVDGLSYTTLDRVALKGLADPVRPVRVYPEGEDPAQQMRALLQATPPAPSGTRRLPGRVAAHPIMVVAACLVAAAVAAGVVVAVAHDDGGKGLPRFADNALGVVDPRSGHLIAQVPIGVTPTAVTSGFGSIWTANIDANSVSRVDVSTRRVIDTIDVGAAPSAIAADRHSVWVVNSGAGSVSRIDPTNDAATPIRVGIAPSGVVVAHGSVWVTNSADGTVSRIDPATNKEVQRIPVGSGPSGIVASSNDVWVANSASNTVTEIDSRRNGVVGAPIRVGDSPRGLAVVANDVWVSYNGGREIGRISMTGAAVGNAVTVGPQPDQLATVGGRVWTTLQGAGRLVEVDPRSGRTGRTVPVGPTPGGITAADGKLWVTTTSDPALHRGGTLRLVGQLGGIDPDYPTGVDQTSILADLYDGLLAFRRASGADGLTIVPDLAVAIPEPTDGGRTYTFRLRSGIQWSSGAPVTVEDVRHGIERFVADGHGFALADLIVGGRDCSANRCHISGITVDDVARTVTIKLVHASGNLLDLLANLCPAIPVATPIAEQKIAPIASTGPYRIAGYRAGKTVVLTRNPYFHEWAAAAQPDGFPDRIEYRILVDGKTKSGIDQVAADQGDWTDALEGGADLTAYPLDVLRTRFGSRLRVTPTQFMYGVFLNNQAAPFDNPAVRRALAYAIDRKAVAADWFAPATVTCQFVPPDYPGYRPYCPFTSSRGPDDSWQGADLAKALDLVKGLHAEGVPVTVWTTPTARPSIQHVVDALRDLHFTVTLKVWTAKSDYFDYVFEPRHKVQVAFMGWLGYDASAENMFVLYRCDQLGPQSSGANPARFCDPAFDRLMTQAEEVQATSPAAANELWAKLERRLVDAAPWIPLVNTSSVDVLSSRVHNFKRTPTLGVLFDQMWIR